jgi:hypothetical protein
LKFDSYFRVSKVGWLSDRFNKALRNVAGIINALTNLNLLKSEAWQVNIKDICYKKKI